MPDVETSQEDRAPPELLVVLRTALSSSIYPKCNMRIADIEAGREGQSGGHCEKMVSRTEFTLVEGVKSKNLRCPDNNNTSSRTQFAGMTALLDA